LLIAPPQQLLEAGGALPELFILAELHSTATAAATHTSTAARGSGSKLRVSVVRQFGGAPFTVEQRRALSLLVNQLLHWCWQTELALPLNRSPSAE
jgi:hypothetical protein